MKGNSRQVREGGEGERESEDGGQMTYKWFRRRGRGILKLNPDVGSSLHLTNIPPHVSLFTCMPTKHDYEYLC